MPTMRKKTGEKIKIYVSSDKTPARVNFTHSTREELADMLMDFWKATDRGDVEYVSRETGEPVEPLLPSGYSLSQFKKPQLLDFIAAIFRDPDNVRTFYSESIPKGKKIMELFALNKIVSAAEIKDITNKSPFIRSNYGYYRTTLQPVYSAFKSYSSSFSYYGASDSSSYLIAPTQLRALLLEAYFPDVAKTLNEKGCKLPKVMEKNVYTPSGSAAAVEWLIGMLLAGKLDLSQKGLVKKPSMRNWLATQVPMNEFPASLNKDADEPLTRKELMAYLFGVMSDERPKSEMETAHTFFRKLWKFLPNAACYLVGQLLYFIKGLGVVSAEERTNVETLGDVCLDTLAATEEGKWTTVDAIWYASAQRGLDTFTESYGGYRDPLKLRFTDDRFVGTEVLPSMLRRYVTMPFLRGFITLLASIGLVEIAYTEEEIIGMGSGIKYVRLSPLGRYSAGLSKTFPEEKGNSDFTYSLDTDRLIVTTANKENPYNAMMQDIAKQIVPGKFITDAKLFMRKCDTPSELEETIKRFKSIVQEEIPENWQRFFAELHERCEGIGYSHGKTMLMLDLNPDARELQRFILSNEKMAPHILKCDGYRLLVEKDYVDDFLNLIKGEGYLIKK